MNITNITGYDTINAVQVALTPLAQSVLGVSTSGAQVLLGIIILLLVLALSFAVGLGLDSIIFIALIAAYGLSVLGLLPAAVGSIVLMLVAVIFFYALYKITRK
jgi:hypothetical protein